MTRGGHMSPPEKKKDEVFERAERAAELAREIKTKGLDVSQLSKEKELDKKMTWERLIKEAYQIARSLGPHAQDAFEEFSDGFSIAYRTAVECYAKAYAILNTTSEERDDVDFFNKNIEEANRHIEFIIHNAKTLGADDCDTAVKFALNLREAVGTINTKFQEFKGNSYNPSLRV